MSNLSIKVFRKHQYISITDSQSRKQLYLIKKGYAEMQILGKSVTIGKGQFINLVCSLIGKPPITTVKTLSDQIEVIVIPILDIFRYQQTIDKNLVLKISNELIFYFNMLYSHGSALVQKQNDPKKLMFSLGMHLYNKDSVKRAHYVFHKFLYYYPNDDLSQEIRKKIPVIGNYVTNQQKKKNTHHTYTKNEKNKYRTYAKNEMIYSQFEKTTDIFFLQEGKVKFLYFSGEKEYFIDLLEAQTIFGNMTSESGLKDYSCIVISQEASITSFPLNQFESFLRSQQNQVITNIINSLAVRVWKIYLRVQHMVNFRSNNTNLFSQICDILYSFYKSHSNLDDENNFFNFGITPEELFNSTIFPEDFELSSLLNIIHNTYFLSLNEKKHIICNDILALASRTKHISN